MNEIWSICRIDVPCDYVLHHWLILEISPMGPCYLPRPGPRFRIFAGQVDRTDCVSATPEIVRFDPTRMVGQSITGKTYQLGPDTGFTSEMQVWYSRRHWLRMAGAVDVTAEVLKLSGLRNDVQSNARFRLSQGLKT